VAIDITAKEKRRHKNKEYKNMTVYPKQSLYLYTRPIIRVGENYVIDIPSDALPKIVPSLREKEIPSYEIFEDEIQYLKATTRERGRQALSIPMKLLRKLEFDPERPVWVSPLGYAGWIPAHKHGPKRIDEEYRIAYYTRVWIPITVADELGIKPGVAFPVLLSGWSIPEREVVEEYPAINVEHLNNVFSTEFVDDHYQWKIPHVIEFIPAPGRNPLTIRVYEILGMVFDLKVTPQADFYYKGRGRVQIDISIPSEGKEIADKIGEAYRTISNQNYTLSDMNDYPFLAEIRSQWIGVYPRVFYQTKLPNDEEWRDPLEYALAITVKNLVDWHELLENTWKGTLDTYPKGHERRGDRRIPPVISTKKIEQLTLYLKKLVMEDRTPAATELHKLEMEKAIAGDEINELIRRTDIRRTPLESFEYCWKYIRLVSRKGGRIPVEMGTPARDYVYTNEDIEKRMIVPRGIQEVSRITNGKKYQGFVWRKW